MESFSERTTHPHFLKEDGVVIHNFDLNERGALNLMSLLTVIERMRPEVTSAPVSNKPTSDSIFIYPNKYVSK